MGRRAQSAGQLGIDFWSLWMEASTVIGLRMLKLAAGGTAAQTEAGRMVTEKIAAGAALQTKALGGGLGASPELAARATIAHYRKRVRANQRRLAGK